MVKLKFIDRECNYDDNVIIFFETLKNHVEDFGYSVKIDLTGIEIKQDEFDDILNTCCIFIKNNKITEINCDKRRIKIEDYLGLIIEHGKYETFVNYCAKKGYLDCLKYAHENGCEWDSSTCEIAAEYGNIECLKYAHENGCEFGILTCSCAAANGHLECLKYAHENGCEWNDSECAYAAANGHIECLKYAHENGCEWDNAMLTLTTCSMAAENGELKCLKYAHENNCEWDSETCNSAAKNGQLNCLKYAHENNCEWDSETCNSAAKNGHLNCLKYAYKHGCPIDIDDCLKSIYKNEYKWNNRDCVKYLKFLQQNNVVASQNYENI